MPDRQFYPGQKVRVVPEPTECIWGWVDEMDHFCGKECTIKHAERMGDDWYIFCTRITAGLLGTQIALSAKMNSQSLLKD